MIIHSDPVCTCSVPYDFCMLHPPPGVAKKPRVYKRRAFWYCEGPDEPAAAVVAIIGAPTPAEAFDRYLARCQWRAGVPAGLVS